MRASSSFTIAAFLLQGVSVQSQNWSRRCEKGEKTRLQSPEWAGSFSARQDRRRLEAAIAFAGWPTAHDNRLQDAGDFSTLEAVVHLQQATKKNKTHSIGA